MRAGTRIGEKVGTVGLPYQKEPEEFLTVLLDDFEAASIREGCSNPVSLLFSQYEGDLFNGPDPGSEEITTAEAYSGTRSLHITCEDNGSGDLQSGNVYMHMVPNDCTVILNMHDWVQPPSAWQVDTFNRMRFYMKIAPGVTRLTNGSPSIAFGTYVREQNGDPLNQEAGGGHYYHFATASYSGRWHKFIIDWHPTARRGDSGWIDRGAVQYPTNTGAGWNYFDALTRWYVDINSTPPDPYPAHFYFDKFELYQDTRNEDIDYVYSVNGVYNPATNLLSVGWNRYKPNQADHEVRYAFDSIHDIGWANATVAPGSPVTPPGVSGYNMMNYDTDQINMGSKQTIYVGIKDVSMGGFREISLDLT